MTDSTEMAIELEKLRDALTTAYECGWHKRDDEVAGLRADAERLDWLERHPSQQIEHRQTGMGRHKFKCFGDNSQDGYDSVRAAIDAARQQLRKQNKG